MIKTVYVLSQDKYFLVIRNGLDKYEYGYFDPSVIKQAAIMASMVSGLSLDTLEYIEP